MAITLRDTTTAAVRATTIGVNKADLSGLANDDVVIIFYCQSDNTSWGTVASGFDNVDFRGTTSGTDLGSGYFYKVMTDVGSEPSTWTFGNSDNEEKVLVASAWIGVDTGDYLDATATPTTGTNDATPNGLDISTNTDGAMILTSCHLSNSGNVAAKSAGAPAEMTGILDNDGVYGTDTGWLAVAYLEKSSAGSQSIGVWTNGDDSSSEWHCHTIALKLGGVQNLSADLADTLGITEAVTTVTQTFTLSGVTYNKSGSVLVSCEVYLCKDNGDDTASWVDHVTSDGATGAYSFTISNTDASYFVIAWKDDSPHVFDCTDHVLAAE